MAGVFEKLIRPQKMMGICISDPKALELETAKEILAEIFRVRISDVDEMIQNRFEAACSEDMALKKMGCGRKSSGLKSEVSGWLVSVSKFNVSLKLSKSELVLQLNLFRFMLYQ